MSAFQKHNLAVAERNAVSLEIGSFAFDLTVFRGRVNDSGFQELKFRFVLTASRTVQRTCKGVKIFVLFCQLL